jgi:subtilisin family serine protease
VTVSARRLGSVLAALAVAAGAVLAVPGTAAAVQLCDSLPAVDPSVEDVPWAQAGYDPAERLWPFSTGAGVTVAVVDTGVDAGHPQLAGHVLDGIDLVRAQPGAGVDCVPHGTGLAGVVAAQPTTTTGAAGLAPDAVVLPVQVTDQPRVDAGGDPMSPDLLAAGIDAAVDAGAQVVDVGVVTYLPSDALAAAVARAVAAGVVVVAPVGDAHDADRDGAGPTTPTLTPYPAALDGVIGVGAADRVGGRLPSSQVGAYVDLLAPGDDVVSAGVLGQRSYAGTSISAAFVAASVALLLALPEADRAEPLPAPGPELVAALTARLTGTATGGDGSPRYGAGVLDPVRALTESLSSSVPVPLPALQEPPADPAAEARAADEAASARLAGWLAAGLAALLLPLLLVGVLVPRARRRRWRAGRSEPPVRADEQPEFLAGDALYRSRS